MNNAETVTSQSNDHILEFNAKSHRYRLKKSGTDMFRPVVSVTTVGRAFPQSEALVKWRIKQGIEEYISGEKLSKAGEIGTFSHSIFNQIEKGENPHIPDIKEIQNCVRLFKKCREERLSKDKILKAEAIMASPTRMVAGTLDRLVERSGKIILSDFKTNSGIYDSALFQLAGYSILLEEWFGIVPDVWEILRFGKTDEDYEFREVREKDVMKDYQDQWNRNVDTYRFVAKYKP